MSCTCSVRTSVFLCTLCMSNRRAGMQTYHLSVTSHYVVLSVLRTMQVVLVNFYYYKIRHDWRLCFVNDFLHYFQKTVSISWNRVCRYFFCQTTIKIQFGIHRTLSRVFHPCCLVPYFSVSHFHSPHSTLKYMLFLTK